MNEVLGWRGPMTRRQYAAWDEWRAVDMGRAGKLESYLMLVATEVRRVWVKDKDKVKLDDMRLKFGTEETPSTKNYDWDAIAKARGAAIAGKKSKLTIITPGG